jgi:hypothetical protein
MVNMGENTLIFLRIKRETVDMTIKENRRVMPFEEASKLALDKSEEITTHMRKIDERDSQKDPGLSKYVE